MCKALGTFLDNTGGFIGAEFLGICGSNSIDIPGPHVVLYPL